MKFNSPNQLAVAMRGEARRTGGTSSILLSNLRDALCDGSSKRWISPESELRSITRFAQSMGFEYLSQTTRNGQQFCNFWLMPA